MSNKFCKTTDEINKLYGIYFSVYVLTIKSGLANFIQLRQIIKASVIRFAFFTEHIRSKETVKLYWPINAKLASLPNVIIVYVYLCLRW